MSLEAAGGGTVADRSGVKRSYAPSQLRRWPLPGVDLRGGKESRGAVLARKVGPVGSLPRELLAEIPREMARLSR